MVFEEYYDRIILLTGMEKQLNSILNHQIYSHYNIFSQYLYIFKDFHKKYTFMY